MKKINPCHALCAYWSQPRNAALLMALVSIASLVAALIAQYGFDLAPCVLCIYQRVPYALVIFIGFAAFLRPALARPALLACALIFLAGAGIAFFHTGVEQHWWAGTDSCGLRLDTTDLEALRAQIMNAPRARCDEIPWSFLGISMAGYNVIASLMLAGISLYSAVKKQP